MTKKILSIDGGGIKGVFPASFLATVEDTVGAKVADHFDLIVGTSTGGIIALALGMGMPAQEILQFYETYGPKIFYGNRFYRALRRLGLAKYDNHSLKDALQTVFSDKRLGESKNRLVIPAVNLETGEVYVYQTCHHPRLERDYKSKVVDVALSTSAAPTFFPTYVLDSGTPLLDGGLWANNPVGIAVVEAIGVLDWPRDFLQVLSIGCTNEPLRVVWGRRNGLGLAYWAKKLTDVFMSAQSSASLGTAQLLAGHSSVIRISPSVAPGTFALDSVREVNALKGLGETEARKALPALKQFFTDKAEPFVPYKTLN